MTITAADLYANARSRIGLNFTDGRLDDNNVVGFNAWINAGLQELASAMDWEWLYTEGTITVVAGTESYATPTDYNRTLWISDGDVQELSLRSRRNHIKYSGQSGYPRFYWVSNDLIYLSPVPSQAGTYKHGYYKTFAEVDESSISNLGNVDLDIPVQFRPLAAMFIAKHIAVGLKDYDAYRLLTEEINKEMAGIADNNRRSLGPVAPQTRPDGI